VTVNFVEKDTYKLTASVTPSAGGSVTPASTEVIEGGEQTFIVTVNTDDGYAVSRVTDNGKAVMLNANNTYTLENISEDHTILITVDEGLRYHSADCGAGKHPEDARDYKISLSELLRVQQLYSQKSYYCDADREDGYSMGDGPHTCPPHDSDYNPSDWNIELNELLRAVQFYNVGGYQPDKNGEDGFTAGSR